MYLRWKYIYKFIVSARLLRWRGQPNVQVRGWENARVLKDASAVREIAPEGDQTELCKKYFKRRFK